MLEWKQTKYNDTAILGYLDKLFDRSQIHAKCCCARTVAGDKSLKGVFLYIVSYT
jgi:hypothetical protein